MADEVVMEREGELSGIVRWSWKEGKGRSYSGEIYHVRVSEQREGGEVRWLEVRGQVRAVVCQELVKRETQLFSPFSNHSLTVTHTLTLKHHILSDGGTSWKYFLFFLHHFCEFSQQHTTPTMNQSLCTHTHTHTHLLSLSLSHSYKVWRYECGCNASNPMGRAILDPLLASVGEFHYL